MRIVVALGGNALLERGEAPDSDVQEHHVLEAARALAPLIDGNELVITHGNGPQVGVLALESAGDPALTHPYPFDALVAETQGLIGNWVLGALGLARRGIRTVCLLTRTLVDPDDPAFGHPTKFVGPVYTREVAERLAAERGWDVRADGVMWRRVVPSPEPEEIIEVDEITALVERGVTVVCAGGGGIPVAQDAAGQLHDVEAVIDKDLTASLLAERLGADVLLLLTDVACVERSYGSPEAQPIATATVDELRDLHLAAGSMGPKVEAACRFAEHTGNVAAIGRLVDAAALVRGEAGTTVTPETVPA